MPASQQYVVGNGIDASRAHLELVAARVYAELQPPTHFCDLFFQIFMLKIFCNVIVHTVFTDAPVYVAEKTNFPILLALN